MRKILHQKGFVLRNLMLVLTIHLLTASAVLAQVRVTGEVIDKETNEGLPGVSILVKGTSDGTITDIDGQYSFEVTNENDILVFSYVGYKPREIPINGQSVINASLETDISALEEVVVVGYGVQKKSDVTGALSSIDEETIQERPVQNAVEAMQGKVAGVDIVTNRRPGEIGSVQIRGNKSINRDEPVLYVVDGIVLMGDLNDINPNDIASIDILKDASATAIYGARASNGVVLITTKKGKMGLNVNYNGSVSFDVIHPVTDWASAGHILDRNRLAFQNHPSDLYTTGYPDPDEDIRVFGKNDYQTIDAIRQGYEWEDPGTYSQVKMRETTTEERNMGWPSMVPVYNSDNISSFDWMDFLTQTGVTQNHNVSVSSGTEKSKLYLSLGYLDSEGTQPNQGYTRYTARLNGDVNPVDWLKIGTSLSLTKSEQLFGTVYRSGGSTGARDAYGLALGMYPMSRPYDSLGDLNVFPGGNEGLPLYNPLIDMENTEDNRVRDYYQGNFYGEVKFTPWLRYRVNFGAGMKTYRRGQWRGKESTLQRSGNPATGWAHYETERTEEWMVENLLYIDQSIGAHTFGVTLLHSAQASRFEESYTEAIGLINDAPKWYDLGANLNGNAADYGTYFWERTLESYMGRVNYSLLNKYLLTATIRFDGSSVLAPGNKWDYFPSAAIAWKMEEENFIKSIPAISQMKLRVGYGTVGNQASVNPYESSGPLNQYDYIFGTSVGVGYIPGLQPNAGLGWEKQEQINLGLDYGILGDRIYGSVELYQSRVFDLIFTQPLPPVLGYTEVVANIGSLRNRGIEFSITSVNVQTRNFSWQTTANFATVKEEITELVNGEEDMPQSNLFIGQPASIFRSYDVDGLWQDTPEDQEEMALWADSSGINFVPGQWKPVDQNGDYQLDDQDLVIRGTTNPKWTGGLTNTLTYKNWKLNFFIYARVGQKYFGDLSPGGVSQSGYIGYARHEDPDNFWSPDNTDAKWPQPTIQATNGDVRRATYVNDGTFFVIRNISLSYNLPSTILDSWKLDRLEIYGQVLNPFIFGGEVVKAGINPDDNTGWREVNSVGDPVGGTNNNRILVRSYVLGLRIGL